MKEKQAVLKPKKNKTLKYVKENIWLYILLLPVLTYIVIFKYLPMFGIVIAFQNFNFVDGILGSEWIGLDNFRVLFSSDGEFWKILSNSLILSVYNLLFGFPLPIIVAILLNEIRNKVFLRFSQTAIYLPHFISWVVISGMVMNFLSPNGGIVNHIITALGGEPIGFMTNPKYFRSILVISTIWKETGWGTIIYLAAITGIDQELYEAADIDGANRLQKMLHITLPSLKGTIVVLFIMRLGNILDNGFEPVFLLHNTLTLDVADVFELYTYRMGIQLGQYGYSTAVGIFKSIVGFVLIMTSNTIVRKMGESSIW